MRDFLQRIDHYRAVYETIDDEEEMPYVKVTSPPHPALRSGPPTSFPSLFRSTLPGVSFSFLWFISAAH